MGDERRHHYKARTILVSVGEAIVNRSVAGADEDERDECDPDAKGFRLSPDPFPHLIDRLTDVKSRRELKQVGKLHSEGR